MRVLFSTGCRRLTAVLALALLLSSCAVRRAPEPPVAAAVAAPQPCQIIFDAGSSGTRLYVYARAADGWKEHAGPLSPALADPVRQIRGKTHADIDAVTSDVLAQLERVRAPGPLRSNGQPEWAAFDWPVHCTTVTHAMVWATAGMRIAEQEDAARSAALWSALQQKLQQRLGAGVKVSARTLTGFEEGLYAWLAVREQRSDGRFGIAEMGGASSQVTFPCPGCDPSDDAVRVVRVKGQAVPFYSHSFLGLGQDEASKALGMPASCTYGVALKQAGWQRSDCASRIDLGTPGAMRDPYNFSAAVQGSATARGSTRRVPTAAADVSGWVLTGAFGHMDSNAVASCCATEGKCFDAPNACFRAVYLEKYLQTLGVPVDAPKSDVSWTQGAALCAADECLSSAAAPVCRWTASGCLQSP